MGAWLLDPDHTPHAFSELLARYGMQQMAPPTGGGSVSAVHHDLALLGPLMVKIYQQLQVLYGMCLRLEHSHFPFHRKRNCYVYSLTLSASSSLF